MKEKSEKSKAEVLANLEKKIETARGDLESARTAKDRFQAGVESRLRTDAIGGAPYEPADAREDSLALARLAQECDFAERNLKVLGDALPEVRLAAVKETLGAIDASLRTFDRATLAPGLAGFRLTWNAMVESLLAVESAYRERGAISAKFDLAKADIPELTTERPTPPCFSHSSWRSLTLARNCAIDPSTVVGNMALRRILSEDCFESKDRPCVLGTGYSPT